MKKVILVTALALGMTIGTGIGMAQMMGGEPGMMQGSDQQQQTAPQPQQKYPCRKHRGMMGPGYGGYGMGPGMMGPGYGGYGMGPGMMGYGGYGMGPGMMEPGCGGYGMGPGMMGYGMGRGQWGGCGCYPGATKEDVEKYNKALDATRELRRKLHDMRFDYNEALRNPKISADKKQEMADEIFQLQEKIREKMQQ
jgi:hypothetical protein